MKVSKGLSFAYSFLCSPYNKQLVKLLTQLPKIKDIILKLVYWYYYDLPDNASLVPLGDGSMKIPLFSDVKSPSNVERKKKNEQFLMCHRSKFEQVLIDL